MLLSETLPKQRIALLVLLGVSLVSLNLIYVRGYSKDYTADSKQGNSVERLLAGTAESSHHGNGTRNIHHYHTSNGTFQVNLNHSQGGSLEEMRSVMQEQSTSIAKLRGELRTQEAVHKVEMEALKKEAGENSTAVVTTIAKLRGELQIQEAAHKVELEALKKEASKNSTAVVTTITKLRGELQTQEAAHRVEMEALKKEASKNSSAVVPDAQGPHFSDVPILGLLPWEQATKNATFDQALQSIAQVQRQHLQTHNFEILKEFCPLGAASNGGGMKQRMACMETAGRPDPSTGISGYDRVEQKVHDLLGDSTRSNGCDICRIIEHFHQNDNLRTLSFWGDSMQQQVFFGFVCELGRRNYILDVSTQNMPKPHDMWSMTRIETVIVRSPTWQSDKNNESVTLKFFFQYRPKPVTEMFQETMRHILEAQTDVLVFNFGLHWPVDRRGAYQVHLKHAVETLTKYGADIPLIVFRETSAQHFNSTGGIGEYTGNYEEACVAHTNQTGSPLFGWREEDVIAALRDSNIFVPVMVPPDATEAPVALRNNKHAVAIAPFRDFSAAFHNLHPEECTHYCHTPFLWMPLWRSLRLSMDARFDFPKK